MNKIKMFRKELEMTQAALAKKLGVTQGTVWHWENGKSLPTRDKLIAMAYLFDCTVHDLIGDLILSMYKTDRSGGGGTRDWLIQLRKEKHITQAELARRVGIAQPSLFSIERGHHNPKPENAKKIADILGFDWNRFFES